MSKPKLDKSRYYATNVGNTVAKYYQDGHYFDAQGEPVTWEEASADSRTGELPKTKNTEHQCAFNTQTTAVEREDRPALVGQTTVGKDQPKKEADPDLVAEAVAQFKATGPEDINNNPPTSKVLDEENDPRFAELMKEPPKSLIAMVKKIKTAQNEGDLAGAQLEDFNAHPAAGKGSKALNAKFIVRWTQ